MSKLEIVEMEDGHYWVNCDRRDGSGLKDWHIYRVEGNKVYGMELNPVLDLQLAVRLGEFGPRVCSPPQCLAKSQILPCPFCGIVPKSTAETAPDGDGGETGYIRIQCENMDCSAELVQVNGEIEAHAVELWNTRSESKPH